MHSDKPAWKVGSVLRARARKLRRDSTDAESVIWNALRAHRLNGESFRRQTPMGRYVADFVCHRAKLIVEIDGGQHFEPGHQQRDAERSAYLAARGYRVLRFTNLDVLTNRQGVLETIAEALGSRPLPDPPPQAGEGDSASPDPP